MPSEFELIDKTCPKCDSAYLLEVNNDKGTYLVCPNNREAFAEAPQEEGRAGGGADDSRCARMRRRLLGQLRCRSWSGPDPGEDPGSGGERGLIRTTRDRDGNCSRCGTDTELYELRRDETMRKARRFMIFEFNPKTLEELRAVSRGYEVRIQHPCWRQMLSSGRWRRRWCCGGALDADLFLDSNAEGILIYAKFHPLPTPRRRRRAGIHLCEMTAELIAKYPAAKAYYEMFLKSFGPAK